MRFQSYFNSAINIIQLYGGAVPLQHFLKQYFARHKKHGSKDRKFITHLCYSFFRLGKSFQDIPTTDKLKIAIFICNDRYGEYGFLYDEEWLNEWNSLSERRLAFIKTKYPYFSLNDVFPFAGETSKALDVDAFTQSFFVQSDVFIRIRPGHYSNVISILQQHNISYNEVDENCISFSPAVNIISSIKLDEEAVVQDYSSQRVKEFLIEAGNQLSAINYPPTAIKTWDCCAGSGGKSIMAYDVLDKIDLTVSDVRPSIIQNLKQRFSKAGIKIYKSFVFDVAHSPFTIHHSPFDLIICDAPCTGSGTWSRTPEQLHFFKKEKVNEYVSRQEKIVGNAMLALNKNGYFLYITCSVFEEENEAIAGFIQQQFQLELIQQELLKGYDKKADSMFAALFKKT